MTSLKKTGVLLIILFSFTLQITAQTDSIEKRKFKFFTIDKADQKLELVVLAGIIQPAVLNGGNVEVDFYTPKMVYNYSHGFLLNLNSKLGNTVGALKDQKLAIHLPYSTGFGIGYRFNKYIDVRIEPKLHKFEVYYDGFNRKLPQYLITKYSTVSLGIGTYFRWRPLEALNNPLNGFIISTSLRFWPKIYSSLENDEINYFNTQTNSLETHKSAEIGIANTPFIFNVAIGYAFDFNIKSKL